MTTGLTVRRALSYAAVLVCVGLATPALSDDQELSQVIGANEANFAHLDEGKSAVPHHIVKLRATNTRGNRCVVDPISERAVL